MADDYEDLDEETEDEEPGNDNSALRRLRQELKQARKEMKEFKESSERGKQAERKLALMEAGIDLNTPQGKLFAKAYDGEMDLDAIRSAAQEYGVIDSAPEVPNEEIAGLNRLRDASAGAPPTPSEPGVYDEINQAQSQDEVMAALYRHGVPVVGDNA